MIIFDTLPFFGSMAPNIPVDANLGLTRHIGSFGRQISVNPPSLQPGSLGLVMFSESIKT